MVNPSRQIGDQAEELACQYLHKRGLKTLVRNFLCSCGELDVIMEDDETIVFVEVRYRRNNQFGDGVESVTKSKQRKLISSALYFLQQHPKYSDRPTRFDVVAISDQLQQTDIDWIKHAFTA